MDDQWKKGALDLKVLSVLEKMDAYGYIIYQRLDAPLGISESTIYKILRRMVKAGYIYGHLPETLRTGPGAQIFYLDAWRAWAP